MTVPFRRYIYDLLWPELVHTAAGDPDPHQKRGDRRRRRTVGRIERGCGEGSRLSPQVFALAGELAELAPVRRASFNIFPFF